jgi:hypothetical protein
MKIIKGNIQRLKLKIKVTEEINKKKEEKSKEYKEYNEKLKERMFP